MDARRVGNRKGALGGFAALAVIVLIGGAAWACTPQASLSAKPGVGAAGTTVTLTGGTYDAAGGPVKVWFDGAGRTLLGTATVTAARAISIDVTIPENATAGVHIISATQSDANGQPIAGSPVNTTFRVEGTTPAPAPAPNVQAQPADAQGDAALAPAPTPAPVAAPAPAPARVVTPAPAPARVAAPAARVATPAPAARVVTPAPAPAVAAAPAPAAPASAPVVEATPAPEVAPAPAVAAPADETPAPAVEPAPASQSASKDSGTSGWVLAGLAILALGLFGTGTGIFLNERKRSGARA